MRKLFIIISVLITSFANAKEEIDLSSPEATLSGYIACFKTANVKCVLKRYHGKNNLQINEAHSTKYKIVKKIVYSSKEVESWNSKGIVPASEVGDIELQVQQEFLGYKGMWSYNFRKINSNWYIISHSAWGVD